jgi:ABC-type Fe3+-hydroxamate transport system substrate-binding protein
LIERLLMALIVSAMMGGLGCARPRVVREAVPKRIIAVAPNVVEILFELGQGERVVGVGDHCVFPAAVAGKPRIGGLMDPRLEEIALLEPDLAILLPSEQLLARGLGRLGIEVLVTPIETLTDVEWAIEVIAGRLSREEEGVALIDRLHEDLAPRAAATGLSTLMVVGREPGNLSDVYAAGSGTFLNELLERLGGENVVADAPLRYPQIGLEEISVRRPQVIVELQASALNTSVRERLVGDWRRDLPIIDACVVVVEGDYVLVPGPRVGQLYADLATALESCRSSA